ncbi:MAG: HAMP domain-containing histidine kinase [Deltaproteobacteria bacterium]|nr:HAMP domain-containing histidine kinase [Deltaproteobacteria bacterium]
MRLAVPEDQKKALLALADGLRTLSVKLTASPAHEWTTAADFERLNDLAELVLARSNDLVLLEAGGLQEETREAKASLVWQAVAGLPLALVLAALFSLLISRPVRQIDRAVRRLGGGDFASPIVVSGPRDLAELGGAIDWLRLRLLELQEEKARFLARASHDLKTPLTAVREGAQLLLEEAVGPLGPEQQEVARILRDNSLRLQRSIQGLLDYSVSEARRGTSEDRVQRVALQALVREVLADNGPAAARKDLKLRSEGRDLWVLGDREQLRVALDNLISNSVKFTPAGGTLSVSVSASGDSAVIDLRDSGPGIAAEDRDHIFEDFYQGKATSDGPIRGSGLGLSIAREHVERHGGSLVVLEAREGAHLRLTLPVEKAEKNARPADTRARRAKTDREDER